MYKFQYISVHNYHSLTSYNLICVKQTDYTLYISKKGNKEHVN